MADQFITELDAITTAAAADLLVVEHDPGGTPETNKITIANFLTVITALTAETAPAAADELALYDASAGTADKITLANLFKVIDLLTAETAPAVGDEVALFDASAGTGDKITLENLLKVINGLTEDTNPDRDADFVATYDASASAAKKVKITNLSKAVIAGSSLNNTVGAGATNYLYLFAGAAPGATEADTQILVPYAGTIRNFRVRTRSAQPGTGSLVFTVRVAGADTSITATMAAGGAAGTAADTTNTATITTGQQLSVKAVNNAAGASAQISMVSMEIDPL